MLMQSALQWKHFSWSYQLEIFSSIVETNLNINLAEMSFFHTLAVESRTIWIKTSTHDTGQFWYPSVGYQ